MSIGGHPEDWENWNPASRACAVVYANGCTGTIAVRCTDEGNRSGAEIAEVSVARVP